MRDNDSVSALRPAARAAPPAAGMNGDLALLQLERAIADLRRGRAVAVLHGGGADVVAAVEALDVVTWNRLRQMGPAATLVLTGERARRLGFEPGGAAAVMLPVAGGHDLAGVRALAGLTGHGAPAPPPPVPARTCPQALALLLEALKQAAVLPALLCVEAAASPADPTLLQVDATHLLRARELSGRSLQLVSRARVPLDGAEQCELVLFRETPSDREHLAVLVAAVAGPEPVLVRVHSACLTGDLLASLRCDCGDQLRGAVRRMSEAGGGVLLYLAQEGRGIGLANKLRAYALQDAGLDTFEADQHLGFSTDERDFTLAATVLRELGITRVRLLTNNPHKMKVLQEQGLEVVERVPLIVPHNHHNARYLNAKLEHGGHLADDGDDATLGG